MTTKEIMAELNQFVTNKPNDKETAMAMVAALTMTASAIIASHMGAPTDRENIKRIADFTLTAMVIAASPERKTK